MSGRRFTPQQRELLFRAANGRCMQCGCVLDPNNWHADHIMPWAVGGATDVRNGQALCVDCNLKKGDTIVTDSNSKTDGLRDWQHDCVHTLDVLAARGQRDLCVMAAPGAGKSRMTVAFLKQMMRQRKAARFIIVTPSKRIRRQWAETVANELDPNVQYKEINGRWPQNATVIVTSYQQLALNARYGETWTHTGFDFPSQELQPIPTIVVLDEVHHCAVGADAQAWGAAVVEAFGPHNKAVRHVLALTGTPLRADKERVAFLRYDSKKLVTDYTYTWREAIASEVIRPIQIVGAMATARWVYNGLVHEHRLTTDQPSPISEQDRARAYASVIKIEHQAAQTLINNAIDELAYRRHTVPDAAMIVFASDQKAAADIVEYINRQCASRHDIKRPYAIKVTSEDDDSQAIIDRFRAAGREGHKILVAVNMVAEGVDIPRLCVGVYLHSTRDSKPWIEQCVGRLVRMTATDKGPSTFYIMADSQLKAHTQDVEAQSLEAQEALYERERGQSTTGQFAFPFGGNVFETHSTEMDGQRIWQGLTDGPLATKDVWDSFWKMTEHMEPGQRWDKMQALLKAWYPEGSPEDITQLLKQRTQEQNALDTRETLQRELGAVVRSFANILRDRDPNIRNPYAYIYGMLKQEDGLAPKDCTADQLAQRIDQVRRWIRSGGIDHV